MFYREIYGGDGVWEGEILSQQQQQQCLLLSQQQQQQQSFLFELETMTTVSPSYLRV